MNTTLLPPKQTDTPFEFRTNELSRQFEIQPLHCFLQNRSTIVDTASTTDLMEIFYLVSDSGTGELQKMVYLIKGRKEGDLRIQEGTDGYYLSMPADQFSLIAYDSNFSFFQDHLTKQTHSVMISVSVDAQADMEDVLVRMQREYASFYSLRLEILQSLCKIFLLYLNRKTIAEKDASSSREKELLDKFMKLVSANFSVQKTISYYADELCITPGHLSQVIKRVSGFRPSHWIQQHIVAEAKRRATHYNSSMKEIAYELGFEDASHFSKFFKTFSGINFTEFRRLA